ncbi:MAG: hypothetical protein IKL20_08020 [Alistipes sp.]|nr:hypothetical protein [Alistipes sp.]
MKKFMRLLSLCAIVLGFTSCEKYDLEIADLVGTWQKSRVRVETNTTLYERLIFQNDGVFYIETEEIRNDSNNSATDNGTNTRCEGCVEDDGIVGASWLRGTYTLDDDLLYLTYKDFDAEEESTTAYKISIRKNTLKMTNAEELEKMKRKYVTSVTYTKVQ